MLPARHGVRLPTCLTVRHVHSTPATRFPRGAARPWDGQNRRRGRMGRYNVEHMEDFEEDDATSAGHIIIQQQKQILECMRLIERDGPRLKFFQKPFNPPSSSTPLVVRSISYAGEDHPATKKQIIVVAVSQLPLHTPEAIHKLKLLAGTRWSPKPPHDSGIGQIEDETVGVHGYIKISCEDFPEPAMNLKWGSDILDNLLEEANITGDTFADIPHDQRHLDAKARKHRKGEHVRGRPGPRPTIKDFPKEWLPPHPMQSSKSVATQ